MSARTRRILFVAFVIGYALILRIQETLTYTTVFLPTMILIGIGFALCFPMLNIQATAGVADDEQGVPRGSCRPRSRSAARLCSP